jgi:hypothetical protein
MGVMPQEANIKTKPKLFTRVDSSKNKLIYKLWDMKALKSMGQFVMIYELGPRGLSWGAC